MLARMLRNHGRNLSATPAKYLPLTQESGGGPTRASIAEESTTYYSGKLYVREDGVVVFIENSVILEPEA